MGAACGLARRIRHGGSPRTSAEIPCVPTPRLSPRPRLELGPPSSAARSPFEQGQGDQKTTCEQDYAGQESAEK
jgi:hypothetical protein